MPELQMVTIFRADLVIPSGKLAAQAGHSFLTTWRLFHKIDPVAADEYANTMQTKIVLLAPDLEFLHKIIEKARKRNVCYYLVQDAGRTVFNEPTYTCLGLGPMTKTDSNSLTRGTVPLTEFLNKDTKIQEPMKGKVYRIFLEASRGSDNSITEAGYYGPVQGVDMNHFFYCRGSFENAWLFTLRDAVQIIRQMLHMGHVCRAEPSITVRY